MLRTLDVQPRGCSMSSVTVGAGSDPDGGGRELVEFRTEPAAYRHWKLEVAGQVATLIMDVAEDGGLEPGYELKLNSYDLGVDIELYDAVQRLRFNHPAALVVSRARAKHTT